jgi:hypothetical protein
LIVPGLWTDLLGAAVAFVVVATQTLARRALRESAPS